MKKLLLIFCVSFFMTNCTEKIIYNDIDPQLEIIVRTESGQLVSGASVSLFTTENDWINKTNIVQSEETNNQGRALFSDLEEVRYYFFVVKNDMTNENQVSEIKEALKINVKAIVETIIK